MVTFVELLHTGMGLQPLEGQVSGRVEGHMPCNNLRFRGLPGVTGEPHVSVALH